MTTIYRGDDTDAFDDTKITIKLKGADDIQISKAIFRCGNVQKSYTRPVFPLVELTIRLFAFSPKVYIEQVV